MHIQIEMPNKQQKKLCLQSDRKIIYDLTENGTFPVLFFVPNELVSIGRIHDIYVKQTSYSTPLKFFLENQVL